MDDSVALERGKCPEIWRGGATEERHGDWYRMIGISRSWLTVSQARDQGHISTSVSYFEAM